jgi:photosystem II stability/assembly factor-like uncharacterized protein
MKNIALFATLLIYFTAYSQTHPAFTPSVERLKAYEKRQKMSENSLLKGVPFRNIGPWVQSGRVVDVDVNPKDPSIFYVCYASGGLWKTVSNGSEFKPIFDNQAVITMGDVAVNWDKNIIWLGTGENNSQRSAYAGLGMYKSTDDGKTWQHLGLEETHHIGRIVLHPTNPDIVWVAALGHLYSSNKERGVYKTTDGGKSWKQTLFVDDKTGAIDIVIDQTNPNILYAAMWDKDRKAWNFEENGKNSAIYKSTNGGESWTKVTTEGGGFPQGDKVGRIGLEWVKINGKSVLYAVVDNHGEVPSKEEADKPVLSKETLKTMTKDAFLKIEKRDVTAFLRENRLPEKYKADDIIAKIKSDKITPQTLHDYIDYGDDGFNSDKLVQAEVYRSDDEGKTWKRTHTEPLSDLFFTYGYFFSQIRVNQKNPNHVYIMGLRIIKSDDGGKTWKNINKENVHGDHHALWVNPNRQGHLINGNDGGVNMSYDDGSSWFKLNSPSVGQFYHINVDMAEPYNVYGGLQDNGVWMGSSKSEFSNNWHDTGDAPFKAIFGGDGMQTMIDTRDNATVYTGSQFGFYMRINTRTKQRKMITPRHDLGEKPLRFNWMTPIWLSKHNQDVLYFGANKLYRSFDKGDNWEAISDDLTKGGKKGNVPYGTLTTIHESPLKFGLLYVGTDDGLIHCSKDGGNSWKKISDALPQNLWISRVQASAHDRATVFASLTGYRWDDWTPYLYMSNNYGETWERIGLDLPAESINVVKEDPVNENILYVGTEHNVYVSLDKGKTFMAMDNNFPHVPVHDLVVHPRDKELVVGTHGRSIYIANVRHIQELTTDNLSKNLVAFDIDKMRNTNWGAIRDRWSEVTELKMTIPVYAKTAGQVKVTVKAGKDLVLSQNIPSVLRGVNYVECPVHYDEKQVAVYQKWLNENQKDKDAKPIVLKKADTGKFYLQKGKYTVEVEKDGVKQEKELVIE